ncbi:Aste57867_20050 [Aphanomyces stellatus]|uniref:Aste57867_20050 protein n=1 Tax=Aphanomyces stellatus TaxID=120398 RepID=A0A485LFA3_9STRA|nr:hypothetical protein As57867_019984 [Aphanomyces stellatus]VFT96746.1 Aste57867_20050 [Aphanomyces stellatus]
MLVIKIPMELDDEDGLLFKIAAACIAWGLSLAGSLIPVYVPSLRHAYNSVVPMVVGGIFLLGSVAHAYPDIVEHASIDFVGVEIMIFPTAYALYAAGYLIVLALDVLAVWIKLNVEAKHKGRVAPTLDQDAAAHHGMRHSSHHHHHRPMSVILLFLVLSFHALLEGVGIGVAADPAWNTLSIIVAHKSASSLVLSMELHNHHEDRTRIFTSMVTFASMTPMGIILGAYGRAYLAHGICSALVCGMLLHAAAMDMLFPKHHISLSLGSAVAVSLCFCGVLSWGSM